MGKLNMEAIQAAKAKLERQGGSGVAFDKLVNGKNVRRILWPKGNRDLCYTEGYIHYGLGDEGRDSIVCRKTFDSHERCPVCEYIAQLQRSKDKGDKKLADAIKPRKRVYFNVIDRDSDNDAGDELKILGVGLTVQKQIVAIMCDPDYGDITDPTDGRDITIKRTGQGLNTEYSVLPKPTSTMASETLSPEELEEQMADLDALWNIPSIEDAEKLVYGEDGDDDYEPRNSSGNARNAQDTDEYDDMELDELKELCKQRGIQLPDKITKLKLIALLTQDDDDGEDTSSVKSAIASALSRRRK